MIKVGKLGRVRLTGSDLTKLRLQCWERDKGKCQECGEALYYQPRYIGDPKGYDMAHIRGRGAFGSDVLENVRTMCHSCHMLSHLGKKPKP